MFGRKLKKIHYIWREKFSLFTDSEGSKLWIFGAKIQTVFLSALNSHLDHSVQNIELCRNSPYLISEFIDKVSDNVFSYTSQGRHCLPSSCRWCCRAARSISCYSALKTNATPPQSDFQDDECHTRFRPKGQWSHFHWTWRTFLQVQRLQKVD